MNTWKIAIIVLLTGLCQLTIADTLPDPVAWWAFEGDLTDSSANGYDGTAVGSPAFETGIGGQALSLDGVDDCVDTAEFDLPNSFTVSAWVNPDTTADGQFIIGKHTTTGVNIFLFGLFDDGYYAFVGSKLYSAGTKTTGWQHLAVTVEEDVTDVKSIVTFYKNGEVLWSNVFEDVVGDMAGKVWTIGQDWDAETRSDFFDGMIDELKVYDVVLTPEQITQSYSENAKAINPLPTNGNLYASVNTSLSWQCPSATSYNVYFGTDNPPTTLIAENLDVNFFDPGSLIESETYYWTVDSNIAGTFVSGDIWNFTTVDLGSGTESDPYQIWSKADLEYVIPLPGATSAHYIMMADIDMLGTNFTIGSDADPFTGVFDGNGKTISNFSIYTMGLFPNISSEGIVKNLNLYPKSYTPPMGWDWSLGILAGNNSGTITNCYVNAEFEAAPGYDDAGVITTSNAGLISNCTVDVNMTLLGCGQYIYTGGVAGWNQSTGTIADCHVNLEFHDAAQQGGIVGENAGDIIRCSAKGTISGNKTLGTLGGIAGTSTGGSITDCTANCDIIDYDGTGVTHAGGLVGVCKNTVIDNCCSSGTIEVYSTCGGLIGESDFDTITNSSSDCDMYSSDRISSIGGLIGNCHLTTLESCHAAGSIICSSSGPCNEIGGLIGYITDANINRCFASGLINILTPNSNIHNIGGLVGEADVFNAYPVITDCYSATRILADVSSYYKIGGFIGYGEVQCSNGHAAGKMILNGTNDGYVGGFVGYHHEGTISNCFWNMDTTGMQTSHRGIGLTSDQMRDIETFTNAGWNFDSIWMLDIAKGFPRLIESYTADINSDGIVNFLDLAILASQWLQEN